HLFMSQVVATQPRNIGFDRFIESMGMKTYEGYGKEFSHGVKGTKTWPTIEISAEKLVFTEAGHAPITMESVPETGHILVNGQPLQLDFKKPIAKQIQRHIALSQKQTSIFDLVTSAYADTDGSLSDGLKTFGAAAAGTAVTAVGAEVIGTAAMGAAATGVFVAGFGTALVLTGASFGIAGCGLAATLDIHTGKTRWDGFLNCVNAPMSLAGMNIRDRLYLDNISCKRDSIIVTVVSPNGITEERAFVKHGDNSKVIALDRGNDHFLFNISADGTRIESGDGARFGKLSRPKNAATLDDAQLLLRDYEFYTRVCQDPERQRNLLQAIRQGKESVRAYDAKEPGQLEDEGRTAR
ncbi:MAG: hypothetical protein ACXWQO_01750, partial [Bdellovibrionota bacterium]